MEITKDNFISALEETGVSLDKIQFSMGGDYIRLSGTVPNQGDIELLMDVMEQCEGFDSVENNLAVEGEEEDIFEALENAGIDMSNIEITYSLNDITVDGTVENEEDIDRITEIIENCKGVTSVENNLTLAQPEEEEEE